MTPEELCGATLSHTDLDGAVWIGAEIDELDLDSVTLRRARAGGGTWERCQFTGVDLAGADLAGLTTRDCGLVRTSLNDARLTGSSWLRSRWREVTAEGIQADLLSAHSATWTDVTLTGGRLRQADFSDATMLRVRFVECDLTEARFAGLRADRVSFTGCDLAGATGVDSLRGATLAWSDATSVLPSLAQHLGIRLTEDPSGSSPRR
ncbi:pentapeptide repeat-containing protein [Occultella kanbiaonis]|uniref:pentapeptide repeat-containing protein n=1 Tax=Occultella kanbiaonis TaxID=2675754 RepID=UPI0012B923BD|nr:pentapeptide repeat-containing protein [Occultella kanbiaonis]